MHRFLNNAEAQGWRLRDEDLYIGKALLDALCLTARNLAVPKLSVKKQSNNDAHGYVISDMCFADSLRWLLAFRVV